MKAENVAAILKRNGLTIKGFEEGGNNEDGMVKITDLVHVQVPTRGSKLTVFSLAGKCLNFYPPRKASDVAGIIADIRSACGF